MMAEKAWRKVREADVHSVSTVRKQREMDASAQLASSIFFSPEPQSMGCCHLHSVCVFLPQYFLKHLHRHAQKLIP